MADTSKHPLEHSELTGEYREAMTSISVYLMERLPAGDDLWRILGQTEALLLEAQLSGTPLSELFPKGGVGGFCQAIVDERTGGKPRVDNPAAEERSPRKRVKSTNNLRAKRRKNLVTVCVITVWVLLISLLLAQYTGFLPYLCAPQTAYLEELHNFEVSSTPLGGSEASVSVPLLSHVPDGSLLYEAGDHAVRLSYVGFDEDELSADEGGIRRWWVELTFDKSVSFSKVSYVSPAETGTATVTLSDGQVLTQALVWQDEGQYENGTAYIRLYFLETPKSTPTEGSVAEIRFDTMSLVTWTRTGVGPQNS